MEKRLMDAYEAWLRDQDDVFTYDELEDAFLDEMDENTVTICGQEFPEGSALKELDPTGFRCALADWVDANYQQIEGFDLYSTDDREDDFLDEMCFTCEICDETFLDENMHYLERDGESLGVCASCYEAEQ